MKVEDGFMILILLITLAFFTSCYTMPRESALQTLYSWKTADYVFPNNSSPEAYINSGFYTPENILILDASVWGYGHARKVFVTTPRLRNGVPASLSIVTSKSRSNDNGNLLQPYPDWSWHMKGDCNGITSVFRTTVDECGRLWVLDTGFLHSENRRVCPPQILIFDLKTDYLIDRYVFPSDVASMQSLLITIVIDKRQDCDNVFAYVADVTDFKLIVYDHKEKRSWKIVNNLFYPYPLHGTYNINGVTFELMDGIFGLAIGPLINNDRKLYFHSLASIRESWVKTSVVRNYSLFVDNENASPRSFEVSDGVRCSQSASQAMSDNGILFFGLLTENSIACWNSKLPYEDSNIERVAQDNIRLQFSSGLKIENGNVWVTTSRFHNYFTGVMDFKDVNFRILGAPIKELVLGTSCSTKSNYLTTKPETETFRPFSTSPYASSTSGNNNNNNNKPFTFTNP